MPEAAVITSYVVSYGAILAYAAWLVVRHGRTSPRE